MAKLLLDVRDGERHVADASGIYYAEQPRRRRRTERCDGPPSGTGTWNRSHG